MNSLHTSNLKAMASGLMMATAMVGLLLVPELALAQAGFDGASEKVCGFFDNIKGLLNMASIAVVTIAVIFAGYQIAFAHKRISDVTPILVGGLLIGAAGQIAKMLIGDGDGGQQCTEQASILVQTLLSRYA
jgi:type IV secretion system protein VirB2